MPIYEYKCTVCNNVVEQRRPIAEMDREDKCSCLDCTGTLKKSLLVGHVISNNVPNN